MNDPSDSNGLSLEKADEAEPPQPQPGDTLRLAANPDPQLCLEIVELAGDWSGFGSASPLIYAAAAALSRHRACRRDLPATAAVALADDAYVKGLNRDYRGRDKTTNVLSFPHADDGVFAAQPGQSLFLGDIVLAGGTIMREARLQHKAPGQHLQHLVIHGLLHLLGYAHESDHEAHKMETLETEILRDLAIPDPYAVRA